MKSSCKIYSFLRAVRGNWRNAIFVSCDCGNCMCGRTTPCSGFFWLWMSADRLCCFLPRTSKDYPEKL